MNDIDRYLEQACRRVGGPATLRQHLRKELKEHLEEAIEALVATGLSRDEATTEAIESLGEPETIREGMQSVYGQSVTSLFVDQAMKWKEKTMKSEWKWNFATQTGLVLIIATALGSANFAMIMFVPKLQKISSELEPGVGISDLLFSVVNVCRHAQTHWYLWLIPLAGAWALFEWRCRSENKALIRTFILVAASLVSVAAVLWLAGVIIVALVTIVPPLM